MDKKEKESKKIKPIKPIEPEVKTLGEGIEDNEGDENPGPKGPPIK
jgi:hypothetical protein